VKKAKQTGKAAPRKAAAARKPAIKKPSAGRAPPAARKMAPRADLGAPVDGWYARQPQPQRAIADALRALIHEAAPEASGSLKWGMPFCSLGGGMMCAVAGFKAHVNLILAGPPGSFDDPAGRLEGDGKTGRHLKLRTLDELPRRDVLGWLRVAAALARAGRSSRPG
jgi:hypothetical protein